MPTELEQQLDRFARSLDRTAPGITVDEIVGRAAVSVEIDRVDWPSWHEASHSAPGSWADATSDDGEDGNCRLSIEPAITVVEVSTRRAVALKMALAAAAAVVLVVAFGVLVRFGDERAPADEVPATFPVPPPATPSTTTPPTTAALASGGMWPQSTLEEVRAAQELADAGDPGYAWQVDPQLVLNEDDGAFASIDRVELVDRFLRQVLGWDASMRAGDSTGADGRADFIPDERYLRCVPNRTNPLYPPQPGSDQPAESCAPTLDDAHFESVSIDLAQLDRQGPDGIWVVSGWRRTDPFTQADPAAEDARATERLEAFLAARIAGEGADQGVHVLSGGGSVPLLYATSSGAAYERYEIERVGAPLWPYGSVRYAVRLFADGGATVVEQQIGWDGTQGGAGLWMDVNTTTENGQPVVLPYTSGDGEISIAAPSTWSVWLNGKERSDGGGAVWSSSVWRVEDVFGSGERIGLTDPVAYDSWCAANGGNPLLTAPADAATIAQQVIADPNFDTTEPTTAVVGGLEAVAIDVTLAPGGRPCGVEMIEISRWIHELSDPAWRLRLYLVDLPDGMSVRTLAITITAPAERFDDVIAETAPIIDTIEFHPPSL